MNAIITAQILHGDLAARNILVTADKTIKICDFGLAKQLFEYSVYVQKQEVKYMLISQCIIVNTYRYNSLMWVYILF